MYPKENGNFSEWKLLVKLFGPVFNLGHLILFHFHENGSKYQAQLHKLTALLLYFNFTKLGFISC